MGTTSSLRTNHMHDLGSIVDDRLLRRRAEFTPPPAESSPDGSYPTGIADEIISMLRAGTLVSVGDYEAA